MQFRKLNIKTICIFFSVFLLSNFVSASSNIVEFEAINDISDLIGVWVVDYYGNELEITEQSIEYKLYNPFKDYGIVENKITTQYNISAPDISCNLYNEYRTVFCHFLEKNIKDSYVRLDVRPSFTYRYSNEGIDLIVEFFDPIMIVDFYIIPLVKF